MSMRIAETEVNKTMAIRVNDAEHKAFKIACIERGEEMAEVVRRFMREYVAGDKGKRKR